MRRRFLQRKELVQVTIHWLFFCGELRDSTKGLIRALHGQIYVPRRLLYISAARLSRGPRRQTCIVEMLWTPAPPPQRPFTQKVPS